MVPYVVRVCGLWIEYWECRPHVPSKNFQPLEHSYEGTDKRDNKLRWLKLREILEVLNVVRIKVAISEVAEIDRSNEVLFERSRGTTTNRASDKRR